VEVKTKKDFSNLIESLAEEILDEEDLEEINTVGSAGGSYMTPFAFDKKKKKKKKVTEDLDDKDLKIITKQIRNVVANILRDIWLKRGSWK